MSESNEQVTPLAEVMQDIHGSQGDEETLRGKYAEFLPVKPERKGLHGCTKPPVEIKQERPEHRFLIFLYAQGMSTKDVFTQLGGQWDSERNLPISGTGQYSYQHLHTIRRQAWFQQQLVAYMEECGKDVIRARLESELMPSIEKVVEIRDKHDAPMALQLKAAESLIDRFLGKPVQQVVTQPASTVDKYEKEAEALRLEAAQVEAELRNLNPALVDESYEKIT